MINNNNKVYIFNADGKFGIHKYMNLFFNLGIQHAVLYDGDEKRKNHAFINIFIESKKNSLTSGTFCFKKDIEEFLEIVKPIEDRQKPFFILWNYQNGKIKQDKIDGLVTIVKNLLES